MSTPLVLIVIAIDCELLILSAYRVMWRRMIGNFGLGDFLHWICLIVPTQAVKYCIGAAMPWANEGTPILTGHLRFLVLIVLGSM